VNSWADQSGNGHTLAEATNPPALASDGPNGQPAYTGDGVNDLFTNATLNLPAPGTTPTWYWFILRQNGYTSQAGIICPTASRCEIRQFGSSPAVIQIGPNLVNSNTGAAIGVWVIGESLFNNATTDYLRLGAATVTGASAGNNDPLAALTIFARQGATNFSSTSLAELAIANVNPSDGVKASLRAYAGVRYGLS
jgi:hypothetical protein